MPIGMEFIIGFFLRKYDIHNLTVSGRLSVHYSGYVYSRMLFCAYIIACI